MKRIFVLMLFGLMGAMLVQSMPAYAWGANFDLSAWTGASGSWNVNIQQQGSSNTWDIWVNALSSPNDPQTNGYPAEVHSVQLTLFTSPLQSSAVYSQSNLTPTTAPIGYQTYNGSVSDSTTPWTYYYGTGSAGYTFEWNYDSAIGNVLNSGNYFHAIFSTPNSNPIPIPNHAYVKATDGGTWASSGDFAPESPSVLLLLMGCLPLGVVVLAKKKVMKRSLPLSTA